MTTLVIHPGPLGDVLLAVPALRALGEGASGDDVVVAAQPRIGALLVALGLADAHLDFERLGLGPLFVDRGDPVRLEALRSAARVVCWFGAGDPAFARRLGEQAPGAVVASATGAGARPVWRHLLDSVGGGEGAWLTPAAVPVGFLEEGRAALTRAGWNGIELLAMIHPGSGGLGKRWPVPAYADVLRTLPAVTLVLHQGPADADAARALGAALRRRAIVVKDPSLGALAGALRQVRLFVGNDSGVTHLAAAVGTPTLALFQASRLAWRPWSGAARVLVVDTSRVAEADVAAVTAAARGVLEGAR